MRIAYLAGGVMSDHPGVMAKIDSATSEWAKAGHEVFVVLYSEGRVLSVQGDELYTSRAAKKLVNRFRDRQSKIMRLVDYISQYRFLSDALQFVCPDVTYSRYLFPMIGVQSALSHSGRLVIEVNSNDLNEYYIKNTVTGIYNRFFRGRVFGRADGLVFVTGELASSVAFTRYTRRRTVIANGIELSDLPFVKKCDNSSPQIVFIGTPGQKWHGLDKLALIAKAVPHSTLHIVGPDKSEYINSGGAVLNNMKFHGYLGKKDARNLVSVMDVGISTLSLYEKKMEEACPLKSRQYLGQGVPMIAGYRDPDIIEAPFLLLLPNMPDNVSGNIAAICKFIERCWGDYELRKNARSFAEENFDIVVKERHKLKFLSAIFND